MCIAETKRDALDMCDEEADPSIASIFEIQPESCGAYFPLFSCVGIPVANNCGEIKPRRLKGGIKDYFRAGAAMLEGDLEGTPVSPEDRDVYWRTKDFDSLWVCAEIVGDRAEYFRETMKDHGRFDAVNHERTPEMIELYKQGAQWAERVKEFAKKEWARLASVEPANLG